MKTMTLPVGNIGKAFMTLSWPKSMRRDRKTFYKMKDEYLKFHQK